MSTATATATQPATKKQPRFHLVSIAVCPTTGKWFLVKVS